MAINSKISLTWNGKEYKVKMTADLIGQIEDLGFHLMHSQKAPSFIRVSRIVSLLLCEAGAKNASVDDVYDAIYSNGETTPEQVGDILTIISVGIAPKHKKKPTTQQKKRKPAK